jgi:hypothetical protein
MIRGPDAHTDKFLQDLTAINLRIGNAEREISSGRRINAASDAPDEISHLLSLRRTLSGAEQSKANLSRVKTEVDTGEQALGHAVELLDRAQVLGAKGATGIIDADACSTIASELDQILGQFVNLANTEIVAASSFQAIPIRLPRTPTIPLSPIRSRLIRVRATPRKWSIRAAPASRSRKPPIPSRLRMTSIMFSVPSKP